MNTFLRITALMVTVLIFSGCATLPLSDAEADDQYHDFIQELVDKHLGKLPESGPTPDQYRELVLLRVAPYQRRRAFPFAQPDGSARVFNLASVGAAAQPDSPGTWLRHGAG